MKLPPIICDPDLPCDEIRFMDGAGRLLGRIVNLAHIDCGRPDCPTCKVDRRELRFGELLAKDGE